MPYHLHNFQRARKVSQRVSQYQLIHIDTCSTIQNSLLEKYLSLLGKRKHFIVLVTIELQGKEDIDGISWELIGTNCKSVPNRSVAANRLYTRHCALPTGQSYTLNCKVGNDGWAANYIIIENSKYCEYAQQETTVNITIRGKC